VLGRDGGEQGERAGISTADYFCGIALSGELTREGVEQFLKNLPDGTTELVCHPGYADDALQKSATRLQHSRQTELQILTDTGIRNLVASLGIRLIDYGFVAQEAEEKEFAKKNGKRFSHSVFHRRSVLQRTGKHPTSLCDVDRREGRDRRALRTEL